MADGDELLTATLFYHDERGYLQTLRVSKATARAIDSMDRCAKRRDAKWRQRFVTMTDLAGKGRVGDERQGLDPELAHEAMAERIAARKRRDDVGNAWVGPRLSVTRIIGMNAIWNGPPAHFEFCRGRPLASGEYCACCDRSGDELLLPGLTTEERKGLIRPPRQDGLKGGVDSRARPSSTAAGS